MNSRQMIFARMTEAVGERTPSAETLASLWDDHAQAPGAGDPALFADRVRDTGAEVVRCSSAEALRTWFAQRFRGPQRILLADDEGLAQAFDFDRQSDGSTWDVRRLDASAVLDRHEGILDTASRHIGIGRACAGFADSGAVCVRMSPRESRALSLLVETHIAVLSTSAIHPSIQGWSADLAALLARDELRTAVLVGGPSKTADIEKVLVTGVHGPGTFIVCLLDGDLVGI